MAAPHPSSAQPQSAQSQHGTQQADKDPAAVLDSWQGLVLGGNAVVDALLASGDRTLKVLRAEVDLNLASLKWLVMLALLATAVASAALIALNVVVAGTVGLWLGAGWIAGWSVALLVDLVLIWLAVSTAHQVADNFGFGRTWGALSAVHESATESAPQDDTKATNTNRDTST
ncbi:MAG: hypothetical protein RJQ07_13395 [Pseudomonadales bacterium]